MRKSSQPTMLSGAHVMPMTTFSSPRGGRTLTGEQPTSQRVQVARTSSPTTDRYVSLTTSRLLATSVFVVGVVDGTNRLTDPDSLLTTVDLQAANRHHRALVKQYQQPTNANGQSRRPTPWQTRSGSWRARVVMGGRQQTRTFLTEEDARRWISRKMAAKEGSRS